MVKDSPDDLVHEIFTQNYWRGHALGRPILGTRQTVGSFNRSRLFDYFRRYYTPKNLLVGAAGHLEHARMMDLVGEAFGDLPAGSAVTGGPVPTPHPHLLRRQKKDLDQVHICVGTPCYPLAHEKRFAGYILNNVLGGGMSSRLFQNIREKRGLVYSVFSAPNAFRDAGCLSVYAATSNVHARQVIDLILEELCRLKSTPIAEEELQRAKDNLKGSLLLNLESTNSRMAIISQQEMYYGRYISLDEIARSVDAVTRDQVQQAAREFFTTDGFAMTVLGPLDGLKLTRSDLAC